MKIRIIHIHHLHLMFPLEEITKIILIIMTEVLIKEKNKKQNITQKLQKTKEDFFIN